jgi:cytochrome c peroxidase
MSLASVADHVRHTTTSRAINWVWLLCALVLLLSSCGKQDGTATRRSSTALCAPALPAAPHGYSDADTPIPQHFVASPVGTVIFADNTPPSNRTTNPGAELGRVLFYDVRLSANDRIACASCHQQSLGFGDTARFSSGFHGGHLARHTMALANARFYRYGFGWDGREASMEAQVLRPITDSIEMGIDPEALERKLAATSFYPGLFVGAFGSPEITRDRIAAALAQFVRSLVSAQSRFDAVFATGSAPDYSLLTQQELDGFHIFNSAGCVNCHRTIAQFADTVHNTGLDSVSADTGSGQARFRAASLRNVAVRGPYMHDGRFATLRQVVEFYAEQIRASPSLDARLRGADGSPRRLHLSAAQEDALVAFLRTLTDSSFLRATRFSDPFPCHQRP